MILHGDCLDKLKHLKANSVDSIVTDPPYGLSFMGKKWDYDVPSVEIWRECLRVLKPGGHLLSFAGTRTYHRMACNIEDAGFEIRDQIMWLYGSGFPKSHDVSKGIDKTAGAEQTTQYIPQASNEVFGHGKGKAAGVDRTPGAKLSGEAVTKAAKQWQGWGTALKPANEPIVVARKPLEKGLTVAANVLKWGTGALNIDAARIGTNGEKRERADSRKQNTNINFVASEKKVNASEKWAQGRWPANVLLDEEAAAALDEQSGVSKSSASPRKRGSAFASGGFQSGIAEKEMHSDSGGASRFFMVIKNEDCDTSDECQNVAAQNAETYANQRVEFSAHQFALAKRLLGSEDKNQSKSLIALTAENKSKTTRATKQAKKHSAQKSAMQDTDSESHFLIAPSVVRFARSIVIDIAQSTVAMQPDQIRELIQCLASTPDFKKCIQIQSLASNVASLENTDTTLIIQNFLKLSGFVHHAIASNTQNSESAKGSDFAPTRFLYQAKASKRERNAGLEGMPKVTARSRMGGKMPVDDDGNERDRFSVTQQNFHPTVKPIKLMEYLIKLVTPPNGTVLDPFMGSGTTGVAAKKLKFKFIGIEREKEYKQIAEKRIEASA